jgi:hypothetical protein
MVRTPLSASFKSWVTGHSRLLSLGALLHPHTRQLRLVLIECSELLTLRAQP